MSYIETDFGINVFSDKVMESILPSEVYQEVVDCRTQWKPISLKSADVIADTLRSWAMEKGASHWCHWFQPNINGAFAEKHEAFLDVSDGKFISAFRGKDLILQEPDGSSFPSGGLRSTHTARGYTVWDPLSPIFIKTVGTSKVLCVPALFISWTGDALDRKTPLLRSNVAITNATKRLFNAIQQPINTVYSHSGVEQEFYLIEKSLYDARPDLKILGRTVQGCAPFKGQELCDHYLAPLPERANSCIHEFEREAWKLGIPIKTRHQEVGPNQFEMAPIFEEASIASDHNLILMQLMKDIAPRYNLAVIFHEKPFAGYNGSGKHNNWSIGTDTIPSIFKPDFQSNVFKLALTGVIRAVHRHQDVLRLAIASAGNDFRLGANEAPPSIISVYLGEALSNFVNHLISGEEIKLYNLNIDLGIPYLPEFERAPTDRNRTSPFAFTGNKFEVRAVGGSQNPAISSCALNTIVADSFNYLSDQLTSLLHDGVNIDDSVNIVCRRELTQYSSIIFDGDGYSEEWLNEAQNRGLLNLKNTYDTLNYCNNEKNVKLFSDEGILSKREFESFIESDADNYASVVTMEVKALLNLCNRFIIPYGLDYLQKCTCIVANETQFLSQRYKQIEQYIESCLNTFSKLDKLIEIYDHSSKKYSGLQKAEYVSTIFIPMSKELRHNLDTLERLLPSNKWPIPSYEDMLYSKLN